MISLLPRAASEQLDDLRSDFRIVIVNGPRQAGKTTLLHQHCHQYGGEYRSLDAAHTRASAKADPESFVRVGGHPLLIDEVQYGGDPLVRAVKQAVDADPTPGRFLLSGSTRFLTVPSLSESLAGRAVFLDLWPLSMAERVRHTTTRFLDLAFAGAPELLAPPSPWSRDDYLQMLCQGGFPELVRMRSPQSWRSWFNGYVQTVTSRDIHEFAHLADLQLVRRLLSLVAARVGGMLVWEDMARALGVSAQTVRTYFSYLETVFLASTVPSWSTNHTSRVTKTPKVYLTDSGLTAHLLRVTPESLRQPGHTALGSLVEALVYTELLKAQARTRDALGIHHYRDRDGREIDFICEGPDGTVVAIEVKASASPRADSERHVRWLRDKLGDRFRAGIVLYLGEHSYSLGDRLFLLPVSTLWDHTPLPD